MGNFYMEATQINYRRDETLKTVDQKLQELSETSAIDTDIAPVFKSTNTYQPGDMVYYRNKLYVFNVEHTGAWAAADVTATDVTTELSSLKSGLINYENQNDLNLEVPDRKNLYNINNLTNSSTYVTHSISGDVLTISCIGGTYSSCNYGNRYNLTFKPGRYYVKLKTVSTVTGYARIGFRNDNNQFIGNDESISEAGAHSFVADIQAPAFFSIMVTGSESASNTVVIEDIMISPYDEVYTPYIPSVDARLDAVESGVAGLTTTFKVEGSATDLSLWANDNGVVVLSTYIAALDKRVGFKRAADGTISSYESD